MNQAHYDRIIHPKTCAPDDYWGQVRRTINGKPVPQEQIDMMFSMIRQGLDFLPSDFLLDLACGNGRLGFEFFNDVQGYLGVDLSPCLIEIARKNFERSTTHSFLEQSASVYCATETKPLRFTKALLHGAFPYFSEAEASEVLFSLRTRFGSLEKVFIGPIPDKEQVKAFNYDTEAFSPEDHTTAIGRWYTRTDFTDLVKSHGWDVVLLEIPKKFYQAHYRFNALLIR